MSKIKYTATYGSVELPERNHVHCSCKVCHHCGKERSANGKTEGKGAGRGANRMGKNKVTKWQALEAAAASGHPPAWVYEQLNKEEQTSEESIGFRVLPRDFVPENEIWVNSGVDKKKFKIKERDT